MIRKLSILLLCLALFPAASLARSQSHAKPTDSQIRAKVNHTIANEQAFNGMTIVPSVNNGVVTLSGTVTSYAAKVLASNEVANIKGVHTVLNNLNVNSSYKAPPSQSAQQQQQNHKQPASQSEQQSQGNQSQSQSQSGNQQPSQSYHGPSVTNTKTVTLPAGVYLPVRLSNEINTKTAKANEIFHADLVHSVHYDGYTIIPKGTIFVGRVISAQPAGRLTGYPELSIGLISFTIDSPKGPQKVSVITYPISSKGKGRGANTAKKAAGLGVLGAVIGAVAGGGKGAAIGALSGGAAGTAINIHRGKEIDLKPEQLLQFKTRDTTRVTIYLHNGKQIPPSPATTPQLLPASRQPQH